jgi:signal transduction histidine kinase
VSERFAGKAAVPRNLILCTVLIVAVLAAVYALQFRDRALYNRITPAEGRYWTAAQYLRGMGKVRQFVYEHTLLAPGEERDYVGAMLKRWVGNMHTELEVLVNSSELKAFFEAVEEYHDAKPLVIALDRDLDQLVEQALASRAGLLTLRERFDEVDAAVARLAIRLRVLDQDDLTVSLNALQRGVQMQYIGGAVVLLAMLFIVLGARASARRAREGQRTTQRALDAVRQASEEVQQTLQARTALLGMVSHELRTPLSKVLAATELIEIVADGEGVKDATAELYAAAETMTQQLNDLVAYAELTNARARERTAELDIRAALTEIIRSEEPQAGAHQVTIDLNVAPDVPSKLPIDAIRVGQIAKNLINNAVKYTRDGSVTVTASLVQEDTGRLQLVVHDTGQGIAPADQPFVWEPFYRAETTKEPGSGLGLAVVKLAVAKLGGEVTLASTPGQGTTFMVKLPLSA